MTAVSSEDEMLSLQLIARLLDEERFFAVGGAPQLPFTLQEPAPKGKGRSVWHLEGSPEDQNTHMDITMMEDEAWATADSSVAQHVHNRESVQTSSDRQYAMRLAAEERRVQLDMEFAKELQRLEDEGEADLSDTSMQGVESVLGGDVVQSIMSNSVAHDPNVKGKAKASAGANTSTQPHTTKKTGPPTCGICLENFLMTVNPATVSKRPTSSTRLPFGLYLPCPQNHGYCLGCLTSYLQSKLAEGKTGSLVFPIRCPECPINAWSFEDEVAAKILDSVDMVQWHSQKLLDTIPRFYCPNKHCSIRLEVEDDGGEARGLCPACSTPICIPCRTLWHENLSCEEYQSLPTTDRNPEDQLALRLAKAQNWRRCPKCQVIVELDQGCNHITCTCGHHFCYKCGSDWDVLEVRCKRNPSCELWDEEMLLEQQEREREPDREIVAPPLNYQHAMQQLVHLFHELVNDAPHRQERTHVDFVWIRDSRVANNQHPFTRQTISTLTCLYCNARLTSLADLIHHLAHVRSHQVWACCGKLFRREEDFQRHQDAQIKRGQHHNTVYG